MATSARNRTTQNRGALKTAGSAASSNGHAAAFDLDAWQNEAQREPFTFTLAGKSFTLPHVQDMDWRSVLGDDGEPGDPTVHKLLRDGLGDQWKAFGALKLSAGGYNELWKRWQEHSGIEPGESPASPPS